MDLIDLLLLLLTPIRPALMVPFVVVIFIGRHWSRTAREFATFGVVKALPEWARLTLLPGLVEDEQVVQEQQQSAGGAGAPQINSASWQLPHQRSWLDALIDTLHVLIVGQSRAGKTVVTHHIATARARRGEYVVVCDPDARPGMWPGCQAVGAGDDWSAIDAVLRAMQAEIARRREQRKQGQRDFTPLTLVLSEAGDIMRYCPTARVIFEDVLRRGGKIGFFFLVDVQDNQVRTLDIEGASKLLQNFHSRIEIRREHGQRLANVDGVDQIVPTLTDPERLADMVMPDLLNVLLTEPGSVGSVSAEPGSVGFGLPNAGSGMGLVQFGGANRAQTMLPTNRTELANLMKALTLYQQTGKETEAIEQAFGVQKGSGKEYVRARALFKTALQEA